MAILKVHVKIVPRPQIIPPMPFRFSLKFAKILAAEGAHVSAEYFFKFNLDPIG
jgi:hypothetical protein